MRRLAQQFDELRGGRTKPVETAIDGQWSFLGEEAGAPGERIKCIPDLSHRIISAFAEESSRQILCAAVTRGMTVEELSAEQGIPLSTCYRKVRSLLRDGLLLRERTVVTQKGKRYGVYRTSISEARITFDSGPVETEVTPNPAVLEKLRERRWSRAGVDARLPVFG